MNLWIFCYGAVEIKGNVRTPSRAIKEQLKP